MSSKQSICFDIFQNEGKQYAEHGHWQSADVDRVSFGRNASLSVVNVAREITIKIREATGCKHKDRTS